MPRHLKRYETSPVNMHALTAGGLRELATELTEAGVPDRAEIVNGRGEMVPYAGWMFEWELASD